MSFYNFKLNDPSSFSTANSPDTKSPGRFVHKTFQDYQSKGTSSASNTPTTIAPQPQASAVSKTVMTNDGRGKFTVSGWKEKGVIAPGGEKSRFRLNKPTDSTEQFPVDQVLSTGNEAIFPPSGESYLQTNDSLDSADETLSSISITTSLQDISRTYSPLEIATLHSLGTPTSIRLVKLAGQSSWHTHPHTDEIFILLRGAIEILYRTKAGEEKVARCIGGELLKVPMKMEHCVIAEEGTEVILLEGSESVGSL
jgi:mannose-6-phosphate isomerase-like protein (cupin superfamily)